MIIWISKNGKRSIILKLFNIISNEKWSRKGDPKQDTKWSLETQNEISKMELGWNAYNHHFCTQYADIELVENVLILLQCRLCFLKYSYSAIWLWFKAHYRDGNGDGFGLEGTIFIPDPQTTSSSPSPTRSPMGLCFFSPSPSQMGNGESPRGFGDPKLTLKKSQISNNRRFQEIPPAKFQITSIEVPLITSIITK